ncbi:pyridoxamine 5'-phosphate oxidase family protein [Halolamina salifodinae]|uniref:Nitroimidazol reductase NimA-like FMN-containing flavoprotein (Pyridoxamine 5'-phosphate oxidase superfamily) n=1 Tax=Halolamina salifodinae TaxID=1202767 RepID=A0A8T4GY24_9EURY|nr:pyridoxamine 5'-phosphate oxidase family protein [Halolamina salifodinae]MBP1987023.1 nitroimidazol reductase NimA-like FMN-containing flavoprotein (pyridoxamine 5'-phosphate oxidase superfamily) [Halolamina salifodinae]
MPLARETEMTREETNAFLGEKETGVLSLAEDDDPYAAPVSYGYDPERQAFYFRLVSTPESEKRRFLKPDTTARFVVYDGEQEESYRSVVAGGTLHEIDPESLSVEQIEQYGRAKRPLFEIWGEPKDDLDIRLYEFETTQLTGRRTEVERE